MSPPDTPHTGADVPPDAAVASAGELIARCTSLGLTLGTAESLTGGLLVEHLVRVPGASAVLRGAVVAYAPEVKREVLGVPATVLDQHGTISAACARAMAAGVRRVLACDVAIATTGVAGPDPSEGHPPGTVHVAVEWGAGAGEEVSTDRAFTFHGSRVRIRSQAVHEGLLLALRALPPAPPSTSPQGRGVP
jgi:nicotinamide-nucleotide amidase